MSGRDHVISVTSFLYYSLAMKMNLNKILQTAEQLFYNYVRKKVVSPGNEYVLLSGLNDDVNDVT